MARALGVSHKQIYRWRKGRRTPAGGAMQSLYEFASQVRGGLEILLGEGVQTTFFRN